MEYFLKVKYEDGKSHWIKDSVEVDGLDKAEEIAERTVQKLNNQFVSSITGKVVEFQIYRPSFCMRRRIEHDSTSDK